MLPTRAMRLTLGTLMAADTAHLAHAVTGPQVALIAAAFAPDEDLTLADLTLASFTDSDPIPATAGTQEVAIDPVTQEQLITLAEPAGGFRWVTGDATGLPQTIYGAALLDYAGAVLLGVQALPTPITLSAAGEQIDLGAVTLRFVPQPIS